MNLNIVNLKKFLIQSNFNKIFIVQKNSFYKTGANKILNEFLIGKKFFCF